MALQARQLPSFPFASPALRTLLHWPLQSSTKCFLRFHSQFRTPQRRSLPVAYPPRRFLDSQEEGSGDDDDDEKEADEIWGPPDTLYRARLHGTQEDKEGAWWGPPRGDRAEQEERLQESEEEGDEDGERPEWLNPSFFL